MCRREVHNRVLGDPRFETLAMAIPDLPFTIDCFDGNGTWVSFRLFDLLAAEATRPPGDFYWL